MKINNEFVVHIPIDRAWRVLTDLPGIAPCMPGAQLTGVEGDVYKGRVKVKVGPVISDFTGTAQFTAKDDDAYRAVIDAKGRDARSAGNAAAVVTAWLVPSGEDSTQVNVETDLKISGKLAQFGSGMIKEVSGKLLAQFVANLEKKLAADEESPEPAAAPASSTAPTTGSGAQADAAPSEVADAAPSAAAVETAPATAVALGGVAPGTAASETSETAAAIPDPSAGEVEPAAGRTEPAEATPAPIAPLKVPSANLEKAAERKIESAEPEALDLLEVAGGSIYKRAIPVVIGVAVAAAVIVWAVARP
ncbi:SRPBCC domain-containing protein [Actinoplanes missouriensis]|uniref:SRPBCC family protein n=1 Tax=Actinoplanes missouriensis TaxID=1866 RepID=UPI0033D45A25